VRVNKEDKDAFSGFLGFYGVHIIFRENSRPSMRPFSHNEIG